MKRRRLVELAQKLVTAKDAAEMARLHADFVKAQIQTLGEQGRELSQTMSRAASGPAKD